MYLLSVLLCVQYSLRVISRVEGNIGVVCSVLWYRGEVRLGVVNKFVVDNKIKCEHAKYTCRHTYTRVRTLHITIILLLCTSYYYYIDIIFSWSPPREPRSDNRDGAITNNIIIMLYRCITHITVKK